MKKRRLTRPNMRGSVLPLRTWGRRRTRLDDVLLSRFAYMHLWGPLFVMGLLIAVWTISRGDQWLADRIYAWQGGRWALKKSFLTDHLIHDAGRNFIVVIWLGVFVTAIVARYREGWSKVRRPLAYLLLATVLSSLFVSWIKSWSNMDCPWDLVRYGGTRPYVRFLELRPVGLPRGVCFPAGHASGGYIWFALYFFLCAVRPSLRGWGLAVGLGLGMLFGISQQLRGAHFLSHDLWTATICWTISASLSLWFWPNGDASASAVDDRSKALDDRSKADWLDTKVVQTPSMASWP
jgi:membrane-associated PAP2 superfamily phosphatase